MLGFSLTFCTDVARSTVEWFHLQPEFRSSLLNGTPFRWSCDATTEAERKRLLQIKRRPIHLVVPSHAEPPWQLYIGDKSPHCVLIRYALQQRTRPRHRGFNIEDRNCNFKCVQIPHILNSQIISLSR